jgi:hypothetical protein
VIRLIEENLGGPAKGTKVVCANPKSNASVTTGVRLTIWVILGRLVGTANTTIQAGSEVQRRDEHKYTFPQRKP